MVRWYFISMSSSVVTPSVPVAGSLACTVVNADVGLPPTKGDMSARSKRNDHALALMAGVAHV
jgi:Na+/H+-dicarboxylate symporter